MALAIPWKDFEMSPPEMPGAGTSHQLGTSRIENLSRANPLRVRLPTEKGKRLLQKQTSSFSTKSIAICA
jgi:hypothetical protein